MAIFFSTRVKVSAEDRSELARNVRKLLNKNSSALRIECIEKNGAQVFYIRDRNIFDYIWEELDAHESELIKMRSNARTVLELKIRPLIIGEKFWGEKPIALWKKIEERILDCHAPNKRTSQAHSVRRSELMYVKTSDQLLSVPDGLSICNASPSKFIARKIVPAEGIPSDYNGVIRNGNIITECQKWPDPAKYTEINYKDVRDFYLNVFRNSCINIKANYFSMVIEPILHPLDVDNQLSESHVLGFLTAVQRFIKENNKQKKTVSLVIATEVNSWYLALCNKIMFNDYFGNDEMQNPEKLEIMREWGTPVRSFFKLDGRTSVSSSPTVRHSSDLLEISDDEC